MEPNLNLRTGCHNKQLNKYDMLVNYMLCIQLMTANLTSHQILHHNKYCENTQSHLQDKLLWHNANRAGLI